MTKEDTNDERRDSLDVNLLLIQLDKNNRITV